MISFKWLWFICLVLVSQMVSATEKVVVLTSYHQEVVNQFESAFEQAYPQYRVEILWRQSRDAMAYLHKQHAPIDVYWTPAQKNFATLAKEGAFRKLDIDQTELPDRVGGFQISDSDGRYVASEVAGFGLAFNPDVIHKLGVAEPRDWSDLAKPSFKKNVALPIPSKVGFAPMLVDTLLQGYGWERGWDVLRQIAANAKLVDVGAAFIIDEVASGQRAAALTIDFFAKSAIEKGNKLAFSYPDKVGYSPAHVAIFNEASNVAGAKAFAQFVLSEQGQKLLFHPDIRKLPVRPAVYSSAPNNYFNPFAANDRASYPYDLEKGVARQELVSKLFDSLITHHHEALVVMWETIKQAELQHPQEPRLLEAKRNAAWLPIALHEANSPEFQQQLAQNSSLEKAWEAEVAMHYAKATELARAVLAKEK